MKKVMTTLALAMISVAMFAQLDFNSFTRDIRGYSEDYSDDQVIELYENHYGVPRQTLLHTFGGLGYDWGNVALALEVSNLFGAPIGDLLGIFRGAPQGNGWGAMAKRYGVKPGSPEFHRMKALMSKKNSYWKGIFGEYGKRFDPTISRRGRYNFDEKLYKLDRYSSKDLKKIQKEIEKRNKKVRKQQEKTIKDWEKSNNKIRKDRQKRVKERQKQVKKVMK